MDLKIVVEDREFRVDADKYSKLSDFMRAILSGSFVESITMSVTLRDVSLEDWAAFHDYLEGEEPLGPDNAEAVYYIADRFGFEQARRDVEALLAQEKKLVQFAEWEEFALRMLYLMNRIKDRRSRMVREKLISTLERHQINVGKSIQEGLVMYQYQ